MTIKVLYSCLMCGLEDVEVEVSARGKEDVRAWMDGLIIVLANHHRSRSPLCRAQKLDEVKIPIPGADRIGGPPLQ